MTREQFEKFIVSINGCLKIFESQTIKNATINLFLSGGQKRLHYSISSYNIAHLLGVKTDIIKEKCFLKKDMGSYEILKYLVKNSYTVYNKCFLEGNIISPFSDFIQEKLSAFCKNLFPNFSEIEAIVEFDKEKTFLSEYSNEFMNVDYFILRKREQTMFLLGLRRKENQKNAYEPVTSLEITKETLEFLKKYFWKQNWYYVGSLEVKNSYASLEKYRLTYSQRAEKVQKLRDYQKEFNASICVEDDALATYKTFETITNQMREYQEYARWLTDKVRNNPEGTEMFEFSTIREFDQDLLMKLTNEIENILYSGFQGNSQPYSILKEENQELCTQNQSLQRENAILREELANQKQALEEQRQINRKLEEKNSQSNLKLSRIAAVLQEKIDK